MNTMPPQTATSVSRQDKRRFAILLMVLLVLPALIASSFYESRVQKDLNASVLHANEVEKHLLSLLSSLTDAETGERGYVITGEERYLDPYHTALVNIRSDNGALRSLTRDNVAQQGRLNQLDGVINTRLVEIAKIIAVRLNQNVALAQSLIISGKGKQLHDQARRQIDTMLAAEAALERTRRTNADRSATNSLILSLIGAIIAILLAGFSVRQLMGELRARRRAETRLIDINTGLESQVQERTAALRESMYRLQLAVKASNTGLWDWNLLDNTVHYSPEWKSQLGYAADEISNDFTEWKSRVHPDDLPGALQRVQDFIAVPDENFENEFRIRHRDGTYRWMLARGQVLRDKTGKPWRMLGSQIDITRRKLAEARAQRLTQLYAALSQCNQAIVRCASEAALFPQICRDVVNFGGMKMAWIGLVDKATGLIRPAASFGASIEYLEGIEISIDAHSMTGRGPAGTSIRENKPVWCQDFQNDLTTAAWHTRGAKFGWGAVASLPLHRKGVAIGVFTLYTGETNAFDESTQQLLIEMAMDISFALDRFNSDAERKRAEEALRLSEEHLRIIIETEPECVKIVGKSGKLLEMNPAGLAMLELDSIEQARQHSLLDFVLPEYHAAFKALHKRVMHGEIGLLEFEVQGLRGARRWLETHAAPMRDENGKFVNLLGITRDITERKRAEEHIQYLANYDVLTGLPNRAKLDDQLNYAIRLAKRSNGRLAVMFVDIDRFKDINDTLGHSIGDAILVEFAKRLKKILREEDMASRLGGDEFILMLPGNDALGAAQVAQKLLQAISIPYQHDDQYDMSVTASIGIALYPDDGENMEILSKNADTAMYRAKQEGRNCYRFFTVEMQARAMRNAQLVNALRHALEYDQFYIHYQPQISIKDGRLIGAEALLRWQHPELGNVSPVEFIPVAEESGLILPIGEWVLRTAVQQLKYWIDSGHPPMTIAVNLSIVQFRHPSLSDMVMHILTEAQLPAKYLELELTEGVAMNDPQGAIEVMNNLYGFGIRLSIDDFGTGYSSLNYLKKFNVCKLKIDQSFVRDIITDSEDKAIVAAIIGMSNNLGLLTIAEGVETAEQLAFLREQGCDEAQGYYYSKPLPADQFEAYLVETKRINFVRSQ